MRWHQRQAARLAGRQIRELFRWHRPSSIAPTQSVSRVWLIDAEQPVGLKAAVSPIITSQLTLTPTLTLTLLTQTDPPSTTLNPDLLLFTLFAQKLHCSQPEINVQQVTSNCRSVDAISCVRGADCGLRPIGPCIT